MWAVTLLAGVNDSIDDARALAELAKRFERDAGVRPRISIIPYNAIGEAAIRSRAIERARRVSRRARASGVFSHKRYSGGSDVAAACGQLNTLVRSAS